ncbi:MAG: type II toxin-antitoxin system RelE/ParE family toxin [Bacteroidetes bacterium]|nr:type II toxin-antitoxin system RelE/ParE family toxin [Bacteroidota bacterium]
MKIVETSVFTKRLLSLMAEEDYRNLQNELILFPDKGKIIRGSGGLRKIRWSIPGRGKSGGVRVIYYLVIERETILMLFIFGKNEQANLTQKQLNKLKTLVKEELK